MTTKEEEQINRKKWNERYDEHFEGEDEDGESCEDCGGVLSYELLSTDADGNRQEWGFYCKNCGY